MSSRMQRLSIKKEERRKKKVAAAGDEYEESESDVSSNVDRASYQDAGGKASKQSNFEEKKQSARSSASSNQQASTQAQTKYNKSPEKSRVGQETSNFGQQEQMDEEDQMEEEELQSVDLDQVDIEQEDVSNQLNAQNKQGVMRKLRRRRSIVEQTHDLRILLNRIFGMRGGWVVKNVAQDFSDGFLFQELFNILYDEKIDCCLEGVKSEPNKNIPYDQKVGNWNKINAGICFNYFQQQFYFVQGTMQALAKGKNGELSAQAIRELLIAMQGTHHNTFDDATDVRDIADLLRINI